MRWICRGLRGPAARGALALVGLGIAFGCGLAPARAAQRPAARDEPRFGAEHTLVHGRWRVHATRSDLPRARATLERLEALAAQVEARLGFEIPPPVDVWIAPTDGRFREAVRALAGGRDPPRWAIAVAIARAVAVVIHGPRLRAAAPMELDRTLAHELAHLALWRVERELPRWANEGLAQWAAREPIDPSVRNALARLARLGTLPDLSSYATSFPAHGEGAQLVYALAHAFIAWVAETYGEAGLRRWLRLLDEGLPPAVAFERGLGVPLRGAELVFRGRLAAHYNPWRDLASTEGLFIFMALLVLLAFARYRWRRRRLLAAMDEPTPTEDGSGVRAPPGPLPFRPGRRPEPWRSEPRASAPPGERGGETLE